MSSSMPTSALPPPTGHVSNFDNPVSLWRWNVVCVSVCLPIVTILVALRTYVRLAITQQWILEDYMCSLSWAAFVTYCGLITTVMSKHGGVHAWDLTKPQMQEAIYWFTMAAIEYSPTILFTKLSVLFLYRRVFVPILWGVFDVIIRVLILIICLFYIAITIVKIWQCIPRARAWDKSVEGTCVDFSRLLNASGLFNTITDVLILLVPVKSIWNLNMKRRQKVKIVAIFTVGLIAPIFSMIGFIVRVQVSPSRDLTYYQPEILLWSIAEVSTGIICVCLPMLGAFTRRRCRGPSISIVDGDSNMQSVISSPKKQNLVLNIDLFDREYIELEPDSSQQIDFQGIPSGVASRVRGGSMSSIVGSSGRMAQRIIPIGIQEVPDASAQEMKIVKTVRIEQSVT